MARMIGIGCLEKNASREMIVFCHYVEFKGLNNLQSRIDAVRGKRAKGQHAFWEVLRPKAPGLLDPDFPARFEDILVREHGAESDVRDYDRVTHSEGWAKNFTVEFLIYHLQNQSNREIPQEPARKAVLTNLDFLTGRIAPERLLVTLPECSAENGGSGRVPADPEFLGALLAQTPAGLALDLDELEKWSALLGLEIGSYLEALPLSRVQLVTLSGKWFDTLQGLFGRDRFDRLRAVTCTDGSPRVLQRLAEMLRAAGATLIGDALSTEYYFPEYRQFKHHEIFTGTRYVYQALENISVYAENWLMEKMRGLEALLNPKTGETAAAQQAASAPVENGSCIVEPGAVVETGASVKTGAIIKAGAVISAGAVVEDRAVIGTGVFISQGAHISGGRIEEQVYIGRGVRVVGPCIVRNRVWIADGATLVRNSVIENSCYIGPGTLVDGATMGNRVIIEQDCQILPGAYIRKDTIFGNNVVFRSEAKNTVVMDGEPVLDPQNGRTVRAGSESGHYGYCGDSILGRMVNEGAGDKNSNVKNDWGQARVNLDGWKFSSGLAKFGAILGDFSAVGCLTVLEPGLLIGRACNIYGAKLRSWLQSASVFAEDQRPRQRRADSLPRPERSLEGRSGPIYRAIKEMESRTTKRIDLRG